MFKQDIIDSLLSKLKVRKLTVEDVYQILTTCTMLDITRQLSLITSQELAAAVYIHLFGLSIQYKVRYVVWTTLIAIGTFTLGYILGNGIPT